MKKDEKYYMYYIGWKSGNPKPLFWAAIGLAISEDCKNFKKYSLGPILPIDNIDPFLVTAPFVVRSRGKFLIFYTSGEKWEFIQNELYSFYLIKVAETKDGINIKKTNKIAINFKDDKETNITRCSIVKIDNIYYMFFSSASKLSDNPYYRIFLAYSTNLLDWKRADELSGFDINQNVAYPFVFKYKGDIYLLFNGENFGRDGFFVAKNVE